MIGFVFSSEFAVTLMFIRIFLWLRGILLHSHQIVSTFLMTNIYDMTFVIITLKNYIIRVKIQKITLCPLSFWFSPFFSSAFSLNILLLCIRQKFCFVFFPSNE